MAFWSKKESEEIIYAPAGQCVPVNKGDVVLTVPDINPPQIDFIVSYACKDKHITGGEADKLPKFRICQTCGGSVRLAVAERETIYILSQWSMSHKTKYKFIRFLDEE